MIRKRYFLLRLLLLAAAVTAAFMATQAQTQRDVKWLYPIQINDGTSPTRIYTIPYNNNALIGMGSKTKGLLIPRLALAATNSQNPLSSHVKGMLVYDTVTSGTTPYNVASGLYYNDGTQQLKTVAAPLPQDRCLFLLIQQEMQRGKRRVQMLFRELLHQRVLNS